MTKNTKNVPTQAETNVGEILSRSERFIETYRNLIIIAVVAVILLVVAIIASHYYYFLPKEDEARAAIFPGQNYLENKQWELALKGNEADYIGFLGVIEDYGVTSTANLAKAYAGICYYHLGEVENALEYLKKFKADDKLISPAITGLVGDCYVDLGKIQESVEYFKKAASKANSEVISPIYLKKAGRAYENLGKYKEAIEVYSAIKNKYPNSQEAAGIEKYIDRASDLVK
jgi:tetratricopeptide (TPR) repeat protein